MAIDLEPAPVPQEIGHAIRAVRSGKVRSTSRPRAIEEVSITIRAPVELVESLKAAIARIEAAGGPGTLTFKGLVVAALGSARDQAVELAAACEQRQAEQKVAASAKLLRKLEQHYAKQAE